MKNERTLKALVIIDSKSPSSPAGRELVMPYVEHLGIPHDLVDAGAPASGLDMRRYPVIILAQPLTCGQDAAAKAAFLAELASAVKSGSGLVSFDPSLSLRPAQGEPAAPETVAEALTFDDDRHFITQRHALGASITLRSPLRLAPPGRQEGRTLVSAGGAPLVAVSELGSGKVVQWASLEWMRSSVLGPLSGMDDVFWRSIAWAARKPFVMRGLPPIVTMRVDDVAGTGTLWGKDPLYWVGVSRRHGFKPWLGLFIYNLTPRTVAELRTYLERGEATAFPHAFGRPPREAGSAFWYNPKSLPLRSDTYDEFIYFDHNRGRPWPDEEAEAGLRAVDAWYADNPGLPISAYVVPHWYELGSNTLEHISRKWGCDLACFTKDVDLPYTALSPWIPGGPFRLHEGRGPSNLPLPTYYADFTTAKSCTFFNCLTEIRDDAGYEWAPDPDVEASIGRGVRQLRRALDSMALASLFTHETDFIYKIEPEAWEREIAGIADGIKGYNPRYMTCDEGIRIVRATKTSTLDSAAFDPDQGTIRVEFRGAADAATGMYVFTGEGPGIDMRLIDVPAFAGGTTIAVELGRAGA
jgi:hypothetical protein